MSDTKKEGKRFRNPKVKGESSAIKMAVLARHSWGSTERILRRNRKLWTRLMNKRRRAWGKKVVEVGSA